MTTFELNRLINLGRQAEKTGESLAVLASFPFILSLHVLSYYVDGRVLGKLWGWFVTPAFGIPAPATVYLIGMILMISLSRSGHSMELDKKPDKQTDDSPAMKMWHRAVACVAAPLIFLLIGYIVHLFA